MLDWCADAVRDLRGDADTPSDSRQLPSIWNYWGYGLARMYLVGVEAEGPRRIDPNDLMDRDHYADAAYSSVLVTDDRKLHKIVRKSPAPRTQVQHLGEWALQVVSG